MLQALLSLLGQLLRETESRASTIANFQRIVWDGLDSTIPTEVGEVLRALALDLDYFEPNEKLRSEERTYWGQERLEHEVRSALRQLNALGVGERNALK